MVSKRKRTITNYLCDICGMYHEKLKDAKDCESKEPSKTFEWEIGNFVKVHIHDRGDYLGIINEQRIDNHIIHPHFILLDFGSRHYNDYNDSMTVLSKEDQERITQWSQLIKDNKIEAKKVE